MVGDPPVMPQLLAAQEISEARHLAEHVAELFAKARSVANLFQGSQLVAGNVQNNSVIESRQLPRNVENTLVFSNIFQFFFLRLPLFTTSKNSFLFLVAEVCRKKSSSPLHPINLTGVWKVG